MDAFIESRLIPSRPIRRAIFLDRDGVLILSHVRGGKPYAILEGEAAEVIDGVEEACAALRRAGFLLVMITNQPDVAKGISSRAFVDAVNAGLTGRLGLDSVQVCFHADEDRCECRKPKPGLLLAAAAELGIDLANSAFVGDRWRDVEAARRAGCLSVFIDEGYDERLLAPPDFRAGSLLESVPWIIERLSPGI